MEKLKKYPVKYKGQKYEVRWEGFEYGKHYIRLCIYEVTNIFGIKIYKYRYDNYQCYIDELLEELHIPSDHNEIYIEEIKMLFKLWENKQEREEAKNRVKRNKENALKQWNGVIE